MEYDLFIKKLVTSKSGEKYWRKTSAGKSDYSQQLGDVLSKSSGKITRYIDAKTIHIYQPIRAAAKKAKVDMFVEDKQADDTFNYDNSSIEVGRSLASAINAVLEIKNSKLLKVSVIGDKFNIKYSKNGVERTINQPIK